MSESIDCLLDHCCEQIPKYYYDISKYFDDYDWLIKRIALPTIETVVFKAVMGENLLVAVSVLRTTSKVYRLYNNWFV